ncbi:MAG: DUF4345 domain-containing protein [Pseudomonadota bacterium]
MVARVFLAFNAIAIGSIGILYLYDPNLLLSRYDLVTGSAGMDSMLRSAYGGVFLACAAIFALGIVVEHRRRDVLAVVAIFMTGAALGRIASIAIEGMPPATIMPLLYFEIVMAVLAGILFARTKPTAAAAP